MRFRRVLADYLAAIDGAWDAALGGGDIEALHDLRVAVRRTRSLLADGKRVLPPEQRRRFGALFRTMARATTQVRDLDVAIADFPDVVRAAGRDVAEYLPVLGALRVRQAAAHADLVAVLTDPATARELAAWRGWVVEPAVFTENDSHRSIEKITRRRAAALLKQLNRAARIDTPEAAHTWRKLAKRLRYLIEAFPDAFPKRTRKDSLALLIEAQDTLGRERDRLVQAALFDELSNADGLSAALRAVRASDPRHKVTKRLRRFR